MTPRTGGCKKNCPLRWPELKALAGRIQNTFSALPPRMSKANKNRRLSGVSMHKAGDGTFNADVF